jgi:hypothetical protein
MIDGSAAIHPLGLLMLRGISSTGPYGQAKESDSDAFDTDYLVSDVQVMASILHMAQNMDEEASAPGESAPDTSPPPISAFVAVDRGSHSGRGHNPRGPRGGRGLPNKCNACGSLYHILSSCNAPDDALLRCTLAKRKMIIHKYGTPSGAASAHAALLSDVTADDTDSLPTLEDCTDEYDDTKVSVPLSSIVLSSSLTPGRDLSQFWVVDSACSINLTAFRGDLATFTTPPLPLAWEGSASTLSAMAQCGFLFGWYLARSSTAQSIKCTPPTCHLTVLSASVDSLVSVGCNPTVVVNFFSLPTLTLASS